MSLFAPSSSLLSLNRQLEIISLVYCPSNTTRTSACKEITKKQGKQARKEENSYHPRQSRRTARDAYAEREEREEREKREQKSAQVPRCYTIRALFSCPPSCPPPFFSPTIFTSSSSSSSSSAALLSIMRSLVELCSSGSVARFFALIC